MAVPVAVVTYVSTPIPFADLGLSPTVDFDALTSSVGDGANIVSWQWTLIAKPTGSAASLLNATTATCTLTGIDLPGGYRVHCQVVNNIGQSSYTLPVPSQSGTTPFAFTPPPLSSFGLIYVLTEHAELYKVAPGARDWLGTGLWPVVDEVDALRGEHDVLGAAFAAHTIDDHDTTATGAQLNTLTGGAGTNASALHTHANIPVTTIGILATNNINGQTAPTLGVTIGTDHVAVRGALRARLGDATTTVPTRVPGVLASQRVDQVTTGIVAEFITLAAVIVPASTLATVGTVLRYRVAIDQTATANNNTYEVLYGGVVIFDYDTKNPLRTTFNVDIVSWTPGGGGGEAYVTSNITNAAVGLVTINHALANTLQFRVTTPDLAGTCRVIYASAEVIAV